MEILVLTFVLTIIISCSPINGYYYNNNSPASAIYSNSNPFYDNESIPPLSSPSPSPSPSPLPSVLNNETEHGSESGLGSMFMMGDSTVDCGENAMFYPLIRNNLSLYPCPNASDSTLLPYFLAKKMGLPEIPTFYKQNGTIEGIMYGLNFGSAQATILTDSDSPSLLSLNQQLRQTFEIINLLRLQLGPTEAEQFINSSIFYLSLGKDDYLNFFFPNNSSSSHFTGDGESFSRMLADEMTRVLRNLHDGGAKKIVYMGVLPLGCAPRVVVDWYFSRGRYTGSSVRGCVGEINQLIMRYNQHMIDRILDLNLQYPNAHFVFCDAYTAVMQILAHPHEHGFSEIRGACCGEGWHGAAVGCQSMEVACTNSSSHVWWDFYNPTDSVNSLLANSAWSGQPFGDMCRPYTVQALVNA